MAHARIVLTPGKKSQTITHNHKHAHKAYDAVVQFIEMAQIQDNSHDIKPDLASLRLRLMQIGETLEAKKQVGIA